MKISDLIKFLENQKKLLGDVPIYSERDDGRSSWISPASPSIEYSKKDKAYLISVSAGF